MTDGTRLSCEDVLEMLRPVFRDSIDALHARFNTTHTARQAYHDMYASVYSACTQKPPENHSEAIYNALAHEFTVAATSISDLHLDAMGPAWQEFSFRVNLITHMCMYLDRFLVKRMSLPCISELGTTAFVRAVVARVQPTRRLVLRVDGLVLRFDAAKQEREAQQLSVEEIRAALVAHGEADPYTPSGPKHSLVRQLVDAERELVYAKLRASLHPQIRALAQVHPRRDFDLINLFATQMLDQKVRIAGLTSRWRRGAFQVGQIARFVRRVHTEVHFRPGGRGAKRACEEFEQCAAA